MQQNIHINVVDPSAPVPVGDLPSTFDSWSGLFSSINWSIVALGLIAVVVLFMVANAAIIRSGLNGRNGKTAFMTKSAFTVLPIVAIAGLLAVSNPAGEAVSAPTPTSVPIQSLEADVVVDVDFTTGTGSNTFDYSIVPGSWTEGYNLWASAGVGVPAGVSVQVNEQEISPSNTTLVRKWRQLATDTESINITVTVPEDTELQEEFAVVTLTYSALDWKQYYSFVDDPNDDADVLFDTTPGTGSCATEMSVYPTSNSNPDTIVISDVRNNQDYRVRKFPDGKCWMIDNLKLAGVNATTATTDGSLYIPAAITTGTGTNTAPQVWNPTAACAAASVSAGYLGQVTYLYDPASLTGCGYLYNWCAATADNSAGCANSISKGSTGNMVTSICPAGWKLPRELAMATNEFTILNNAMETAGTGYNSTNYRNWWPNGAFAGALSGYYTPEIDPGSGLVKMFSEQGTVGWYWTAAGTTSAGRGYAGALQINDNQVLPGTYNFKDDAFAIRCFTG